MNVNLHSTHKLQHSQNIFTVCAKAKQQMKTKNKTIKLTAATELKEMKQSLEVQISDF